MGLGKLREYKLELEPEQENGDEVSIEDEVTGSPGERRGGAPPVSNAALVTTI